MELLVEAGIHVEVVPGVTAAAGVSAYAGIPLTHREHAQSVVFATGFLKEGKIDLDWPMLARPQQTVVIYMGISRLADICAQLVAHGLPPSAPAGVIEAAPRTRSAWSLPDLRHPAAAHAGRGRAPALADRGRQRRRAVSQTGLVRARGPARGLAAAGTPK